MHCGGSDSTWENLSQYRQTLLQYTRANWDAQHAWLGRKESIERIGWLTQPGAAAPAEVLAYVKRVRQDLITEGAVSKTMLLPDLVRAAIANEKFNRGGASGRVSAYLADSAVQQLLLNAGASVNASVGWFADEARAWAGGDEGALYNFAYRVQLSTFQRAREPVGSEQWGSLPSLSHEEVATRLRQGLEAYIAEHCQGEDMSVLLPEQHDASYTAYAHFFGSQEGKRLRLTMPAEALTTVMRVAGKSCADYEVTLAGRTLTSEELYSKVKAAIANDDHAEEQRTQAMAGNRKRTGGHVRVWGGSRQQITGHSADAPGTTG